MPISVAKGKPKAVASPKLRCSLCRVPSLRDNSPSTAGEIEIANDSLDTIEISHRGTILLHLNLVVRDGNGEVVSDGHYGNLFSPTRDSEIFHLLPGQAFRERVALFATVPPGKLKPGNYRVAAVFEAGGQRVASSEIEVIV